MNEEIKPINLEEEKKTGVLSKLGRAFKKVASFIVRRETIEAAKEVSVFVPVVGNVMAIVLGLVEEAEVMFAEPGKGKEKFAWVLENALSVMAAAGYEEKRVNGLIELALLVLKLEARLIVDKPDDE